MRLKMLAVAASATAIITATPAVANETRLEVRGGVVWCCGVSDETIGVAVGHDFDLGTSAFIGVEGVADTNFDFVDPTIGVNARVGAKVGETTKLFGLVGYAYETDFDIDDVVIGAGMQTAFGNKALVSLQYQRYLDLDINRASVGVGFRF